MSNYSFTVITPCYNGEKFIKSCIEAIAKLNYNHDLVEHIVVDDGSTDNTKKICEELVHKYSHLKFYSKINGNWGSVINYVRDNKLVHNNYVVICDADDFLHNEALNIVNTICDNSDIVVGCYKTFNDKRVKFRYANYFYTFKRSIKAQTNLHLYYAPAIVPTCIYVKKDVFYKTKPLSTNVMYQDTCLFVDCFKNAKSLKISNRTFSYYRKEQTNNTMAQRFTERGIESFDVRFQNWVNTDSVEVMAYDLIFAKSLRKKLIADHKTYIFNRKPCFKVFPWWMRMFIALMYQSCKKVILIKENK